ncbi:hypothetical protein PYW07_014088 [Mythimna separata]|uniref:Uncharacterized protein n=1 Tax=Mythimna separata TaxID=271217 RepID=A0AAD8DPH2_MYTSE|nr:hypothetical protein PYW07_014088 [Mythimna separata]
MIKNLVINIKGILLVVTLICHTQTVEEPTVETQTVEEPMRHNLETKPNADDDDNITINRRQETSEGPQKKQWKFEDYLKKFEPSTIWEQIDKQKKYNGLVLSDEEQSEIMYRSMDPTDEIMKLKIEVASPKPVKNEKSGRRNEVVDHHGWRPPAQVPGYTIDRFYLRNRLYELMKQAIYMTRNKMVVMQILREEHMNSSLYKMGFLFNKADNAAKTFGKFSFRAYRACLLARERVKYRLPAYDLMAANERQLFLWFNIELLADLIEHNHLLAQEIYQNFTLNRLERYDKQFLE